MGKNKEALKFDFISLGWVDRILLHLKYDFTAEMKYARKFRNI